MAVTSGFFDAVYNDGKYDRAYDASDFSQYFSMFVGNGVFANPTNTLQVMANSESNMSVIVKPGIGWINGYFVKNDADYPLTIAPADGSQNRIDAIVLRWSKEDREIKIMVKQGSLGSVAVAPTPQRDDTVHELVLAHVRVDRGISEITQSEITDKRAVKDLCGWVAGIIDQIDATDLFAQFENEFRTWFEDIQAQLSGDIAANLQRQITQNANDIDDLEQKLNKIEPVGCIKSTVQSSLGENWLLCNGDKLTEGEYPELEAVIKTSGIESEWGSENKVNDKWYIDQYNMDYENISYASSDKNTVVAILTRKSSSQKALRLYYIDNIDTVVKSGAAPNFVKLFELIVGDSYSIIHFSVSYANGVFFVVYATQANKASVSVKCCTESSGLESVNWKSLTVPTLPTNYEFTSDVSSITDVVYNNNKYYFIIDTLNASSKSEVYLYYIGSGLSGSFTSVKLNMSFNQRDGFLGLCVKNNNFILVGNKGFHLSSSTVTLYTSNNPIDKSSWSETALDNLVDGAGTAELPAKLTTSFLSNAAIYCENNGEIRVACTGWYYTEAYNVEGKLAPNSCVLCCSGDFKDKAQWKLYRHNETGIDSGDTLTKDDATGVQYYYGKPSITRYYCKDDIMYFSALRKTKTAIFIIPFDCSTKQWGALKEVRFTANTFGLTLLACPKDIFIVIAGRANYYYDCVAVGGKYLPMIEVDRGNAFIKAKSEVD